MSNFFGNIFKKMMNPRKDSEKKAKEEEDILGDVNLNFEVSTLKTHEVLDSIVSNLKISGVTIDRYEYIFKIFIF